MPEHPLLDSIRELAEPLEQEARELLERYETVSLELSALRDAERALIAPADPPRKPLAGRGQTRTEKAIEVRAQRREVVFGIIEKAGGWIKPLAILEAASIPRQAYQLAIRDLTDAGRIESQGSRGSLAFRVAGAAEPPQEPPPDPPEGRASPEPPEAPSEPDSAPEPPPSPGGTETTIAERGDRAEQQPRSPARAARRARRRGHQPQPPAPAPPAPRPAKSRSDGIERPPAAPSSNGHFELSDEHREILEAVSARPLTAEGIAIKLRVGVAVIVPLCQALVNARYLQRGAHGQSAVYGLGSRSA